MQRVKSIILILVFALWAAAAFTGGFYHEPWADEAQSWLIAKNCSFFEIIFHAAKYEGTPALWFFILKILQLFHFSYDYIFLIPLFFTGIGVYLLVFKSKLPFIVKCFFPFTYYMLYQYPVFARNYCLVFPILAVLALVHNQRFKKPVLYTGLLMLLASASAHGFAAAGIIYVFFLIGIIKNGNADRKTALSAAAAPVFMLLTAMYTNKPYDCTFNASFNFPDLEALVHSLFSAYMNLDTNTIIDLAAIAGLYISAFIYFCRTSSQILYAFALNFGIVFIAAGLYTNLWHLGYIPSILIYTLWTLREENAQMPLMPIDKYLKTIFTIFYVYYGITQINQALFSINCDINKIYSPGKTASEFIKKNSLDKFAIKALGYKTASIQPYFNKNIFINYSKPYWQWKQEEDNMLHKKFKQPADVIVFGFIKNNITPAVSAEDYDMFVFEALETARGKYTEKNRITIFVKKGIIK